jgi:hypothetical protein
MVLSNCAIDAVSLYPTYRKPFDLIFQSTKTEGWLAQVDDFRTFLGELVSSLPHIESGHAGYFVACLSLKVLAWNLCRPVPWDWRPKLHGKVRVKEWS